MTRREQYYVLARALNDRTIVAVGRRGARTALPAPWRAVARRDDFTTADEIACVLGAFGSHREIQVVAASALDSDTLTRYEQEISECSTSPKQPPN